MRDMDTDENVQQAYEMQLENDTLYAVVGDSFMVRPVFTPEVVSNVEIFWYTDFDSIIRVMNDSGDPFVASFRPRPRTTESFENR